MAMKVAVNKLVGVVARHSLHRIQALHRRQPLEKWKTVDRGKIRSMRRRVEEVHSHGFVAKNSLRVPHPDSMPDVTLSVIAIPIAIFCSSDESMCFV